MSDLNRMTDEWLDLSDQERRELVAQIEQGPPEVDQVKPRKTGSINALLAEYDKLYVSPRNNQKRMKEIQRELADLENG